MALQCLALDRAADYRLCLTSAPVLSASDCYEQLRKHFALSAAAVSHLPDYLDVLACCVIC
jgi:hypothetical protein